MRLSWQTQVDMLLKATNKADREKIIEYIKKAALPAVTDKAVKVKNN